MQAQQALQERQQQQQSQQAAASSSASTPAQAAATETGDPDPSAKRVRLLSFMKTIHNLGQEQLQKREAELREALLNKGAGNASTLVDSDLFAQFQEEQHQHARQDQIANAEIKSDAESYASEPIPEVIWPDADDADETAARASTPVADDIAHAGDDTGGPYRREGLPSRVVVDRAGEAYFQQHGGVDLQVAWGALEYELIFHRELRPKYRQNLKAVDPQVV